MLSNLPVYQFDGYTFRPALPKDQTLSRIWNLMDREHTWEAQYPDYWIQQNERVTSYLLEDEIGVVFFVKAIRQKEREVEITIQFDRQRGMVSKTRVMMGMQFGFEWLKKALPENGFRTLYFISKNPELIAFAEKAMGFVKDGERYVHQLAGQQQTSQAS